MNIDKVEELAKKIYGVKVTKNPLGNPMYEFTGTELAMFAELIVRECLEMMGTNISGTFNSDWDFDTQVKFVKKHFGVEE